MALAAFSFLKAGGGGSMRQEIGGPRNGCFVGSGVEMKRSSTARDEITTDEGPLRNLRHHGNILHDATHGIFGALVIIASWIWGGRQPTLA